LEIPDTVSRIEDDAFAGSGLTSVKLPSQVSAIGGNAFATSTLQSITLENARCTIANGETTLGDPLVTTIYAASDSTAQRYAERYGYDFVVWDGEPDVVIVDSGTCGDNLTWTLTDDGLLTISGEGEMADYKKPADIPWYSLKNKIQTVDIQADVTNIGDYTFYGCSSLTSIAIPEGVTSIGVYAFAYCEGLTSITLPENVTSIGNYVFYECSSLTNITIPDTVTSIGNSAFYRCSSLTSVAIPDSVTSIGSYAFTYCTSLTSVTISNNVTSISAYAFFGCENLTSVVIPDGVTSIGMEAFYACTSLKSVTIPDSVTRIGGGAFGKCHSLTSITIPEGVTSIGDYAFEYCSSLTSVTVLNKDCIINNDANTLGLAGTTVIHGYAGSTAQTYADTYGYTFVALDDEPDEHEHIWDEGIVTIDRTCTADGEKTYTCTVCNETKTDTIQATGHTLMGHEAQAATCTEKGWEAYETCSQCDYTTYKEIPAIGHVAETQNAKAATCTEAGYTGDEVCTVCNETITKGAIIKATGHDWDSDYTVDKDATCSEEGSKSIHCKNCAETKDVTSIAKVHHPWGVGNVTTPATCTTTGVKTYICTACDATKTETISALGHIYTVTVVPPTCTTKGYTLYECARCNHSYTDNETAMLDHVADDDDPVVVTVDPQCTISGYTDTIVNCANCGKELSRTRAYIKALGHQFEVTQTVEPTCTKDGTKTYTCTVCGVIKTETISRLGHKYTETVVKPTCTTAGYTVYTCTRKTCGNSYRDNYTNALGHKFKVTQTVGPTCTNAGYKEYTCSRNCGATYKSDYVSATGKHEWMETNKVEDQKTGITTTYYTCKICKTTKTEQVKATAKKDDSGFGYNMNVDIPVIPSDPNQRKETIAGVSGDDAHNTIGEITGGVIDQVLAKEENQHIQGVDEDTAARIQDAVNDDQDITTKVVAEVTGKPTDYDTAVKSDELQEKLADQQVAQYFNIEVQLEADGEPIGNITEVSQPINITIQMPTDMEDRLNYGYSVMRIHDGEMEEVNGVKLDGTTLTVPANKFSTYVVNLDKVDLADVTVAAIEDCAYDDGKEIEPSVTVTFGDLTLAPGTDYTVEYTDNTDIGTATATLTGIGDYTGTVTETFTILAKTCQHANTDTRNENEVAATCKNAGSYDKVTYCTDCQEVVNRESVSIPVDKTAHDWDSNYTVDKEATCTEPGQQSIHCTLCDEVMKEAEIPVTGHKMETRGDKAATCTEDGYTGDVVCKVCDTTIVKGTAINKIEHTPDEAVKENEVTATCNKKGTYDEVVYCTGCKTELSRKTVETDKIEHTPGEAVKEKEVAAKCDQKGSYDEVVYCTKCGEELSRTAVETDKIEHTPGEAVTEKEVAAKCNKKGTYDEVVYCTECKTELSRKTVETAKIEHTPGETVKEKEVAAKCDQKGSYDEVVYCTKCKTELSRKTVETDKIAHTPGETVKEKEVAAKCDQKGSYDEVVYCTKCKTELSRKTVETAMIAHTYNAGEVTTSATCTTTGVKTYTCTVCKTTKTETIKALGHSYTTTVVKPTYTAEGYTLYECTRCDASYKSDVTAKLSYQKGDVDGNGKVELKDVTLLFQYVNKQITQDKVKVFAAADVDGNGKVELKDVTRLFQYVNKQINSL
jgi:hypothetical protein